MSDSMFDEIVKTEFKPDGSVEVELVHDNAQELESATTDFVRSWRRFREIDASVAATSGATSASSGGGASNTWRSPTPG
jgi:hypothetical protein